MAANGNEKCANHMANAFISREKSEMDCTPPFALELGTFLGLCMSVPGRHEIVGQMKDSLVDLGGVLGKNNPVESVDDNFAKGLLHANDLSTELHKTKRAKTAAAAPRERDDDPTETKQVELNCRDKRTNAYNELEDTSNVNRIEVALGHRCMVATCSYCKIFGVISKTWYDLSLEQRGYVNYAYGAMCVNKTSPNTLNALHSPTHWHIAFMPMVEYRSLASASSIFRANSFGR